MANRFARFTLLELRTISEAFEKAWPSAVLGQLRHELSQVLAEEEEFDRMETEELMLNQPIRKT